MRNTALNIRRHTPRIGAEIVDKIDVANCRDADISEIRRLLVEYLVVFFRGQKMTPAQHVAFASRFGTVPKSHNPRVRHPEHPEISMNLNDENSKTAYGEMWHTDSSSDAEPPMASILFMHEIPPDGGDTLFASTQLAYDALSESMKAYLETLTAIHDRIYALRDQHGIAAFRPGDVTPPVAEHPVVRTHPESGRKGLFINRAYTSRIVQLKKAESDALLRFLFAHIEQPIFQCRFKWEIGSIAFWDNRSAQHFPIWDYFPHRRFAHSVKIAGDRPYLQAPVAGHELAGARR